MSRFLLLIFFFGLIQFGKAQTRMYVTGIVAGASEFAFEWDYAEDGTRIGYITKFGQPGVEIAFEKRLSGQFYVYSGLGLNRYKTVYIEPGISGTSQVTQTFVSVPLLLRINNLNQNKFYVDLGLVPTYLFSAKLTESYTDPNSGIVTSADGAVASYLPRVGIQYRTAITFAIRRFVFGAHLNLGLTNQGTGDLIRNWDLTSSESIFLNSDGAAIKLTSGIHLGFRIK